MTLSGTTVGVVGGLAAFPRRLAAREVAAQGGQLRRGVTRRTPLVVLGRRLLERGDAEIEATIAGVGGPGRELLSENGFLRLLGLVGQGDAAELSRASLAEQSGLPEGDLHRLALFDAFERHAEPFSFRDLILARKYAGLIAGGAGWAAIARSVHRSGPVASLTAKSLQAGGARICEARDGGLAELDGQLLLDLAADDVEPEALFAAAEAAEAGGDLGAAVGLYGRCLGVDPGDSVAAFNRANCLRATGRRDEAGQDYARALKLDPGFVEAWFNLGCLMREAGRGAAARRYLERAVALDPDFADAIFNLAALAFDGGDLAEAGRLWTRYLELDSGSEWARTAERGIRYVALAARQSTA